MLFSSYLHVEYLHLHAEYLHVVMLQVGWWSNVSSGNVVQCIAIYKKRGCLN